MDRERQRVNDYKKVATKNIQSTTVELQREDILKRLVSTIKRPQHRHFILAGEAGSGRSYCFKQLQQHHDLQHFKMLSIDLGQIALQHPQDPLGYLSDYLDDIDLSNQNYIVFLDEIERFHHYQPQLWLNLISELVERSEATPHHLGISITNDLYYQYLANDYAIQCQFETLTLAQPSPDEVTQLVINYLEQQQFLYQLSWSTSFVQQLIQTAHQYVPQALPGAAFQLLDQVLGHASQLNTQKKLVLDNKLLNQVLASWYGIQPLANPTSTPERLLHLAQQMGERIIGQKAALHELQQILFNQQLNITQTGHITSLIFTGPPHVGKTAAARTLTTQLFGSQARSVIIDLAQITVPNLIHILDRYLRQSRVITYILTQAEQAQNEVLIYLQQLLEDNVFYNHRGQALKMSHKLFIVTYHHQANTNSQSNTNSSSKNASHLQLILQDLPDEEPKPTIQDEQSQQMLNQLNLPDPFIELSYVIHFNALTITNREHITHNHCQKLAQRAMLRYGVILQFQSRFAYRFLQQHELQYASPQILQKQLQRHIDQLLNQHLSLNQSNQWQELLIDIDDQGQLSAQDQKRLL